LKSWQALFQDAADFATEIGRERLISISHSSDHSEGIVTVWFWGRPDTCHKCGYNLTGNTSGVCPECGSRIWADAE
jgi:predicted Zn-ribbon and HTH transcriptional regulator